MSLGIGIAIGVGIGAALLAATGDAWWIAVGAGVGVAIGEAIRRRRYPPAPPVACARCGRLGLRLGCRLFKVAGVGDGGVRVYWWLPRRQE